MLARKLRFVPLLAALICGTTSFGAFNLQITEIWPGQSGSDISDDWIEITNYGTMPWTLADGTLSVEDGSGSDGTFEAIPVSGLSSIAPSQSVIVLFEANAADAAAFPGIWGISGVSVGYADGSGIGLGAGGENAYLFLTASMVDTVLDVASYPDSESSPMFIENEDQSESWDVVLGAWSTVGNASGAFESIALGNAGNITPAIGSPGGPRVPEPSTIVLATLATVGLLATRLRK